LIKQELTISLNDIAIKKRLISQNYKMVNLINPIDFQVAKLAIDQDIDSYNYIVTPNEEITSYYEKALEQFEKFQAQNFGQLYCESSKDCTIIILDSHRSVSQQLEELISPIELKRATIACGYCYNSGLSLLKETITKTVYNGVPTQFIIGSLQNYRSSAESDSIITGIDISTIRKLNEYLAYDNVSIYTCEDRFYHGKLYVFEGQDKSIICMGSSNVSKSAYISNYELNLAFIVPTKSSLKEQFDLWVKQLLQYSTRMNCFDEALFSDNELKLEGSVVIKQIAKNVIQRRIDDLTNSEVQYRLNLWMSYSPDIIAEDLGILVLPNYIVFVYNKYKLLVLESFTEGNSYFCLHYDDSFEAVINNISTFSKTELFEYSQMTKRGYHISNKFTLENNIRRYFRS
jgi:HKD family nuclease